MKQPLASWFSWLELRPLPWKVVGSVPSQGTYLGCRFEPRLGHMEEAMDRCFSLLPTLPPSPKPMEEKAILG